MHRLSYIAAAAVLSAIVATPALSHKGAKGIVKERMDVMKSLGGSMKSLVAVLKGEAPFKRATIKATARAMVAHAVKMKTQFPHGSDHKPTRALPAVWTNRAEFDKLANALAAAANQLDKAADTAKSGKALTPHIIAIGQTCKSCHEKYRAPDD